MNNQVNAPSDQGEEIVAEEVQMDAPASTEASASEGNYNQYLVNYNPSLDFTEMFLAGANANADADTNANTTANTNANLYTSSYATPIPSKNPTNVTSTADKYKNYRPSNRNGKDRANPPRDSRPPRLCAWSTPSIDIMMAELAQADADFEAGGGNNAGNGNNEDNDDGNGDSNAGQIYNDADWTGEGLVEDEWQA
ncbi:hypothetical protein OHC33_010929 [Knufia fluminis]|uniref:Uncharacterized protein n=1 Tax=Knufia fluminis TaxID=191047 RepID=A0AAN8EDR1_9EURO|nr:hypothetical protein OHC33_010929 [Knufia fluminis]